MFYGEGINLFGQSWAQLHFVENPGMAFGYNMGGDIGKVALSLFRIFAVGFLIYFINQLIKSKAKFGLLACFAFILAGAVGNILDSTFYGYLFDKGTTWNAEINDWVHYTGKAEMDFSGYANFLQGCVVDMLYFPMLEGNFPAWVPFWGGESFLFFRPVFNVADMSITIGVLSIILFQRSFFSQGLESSDAKVTEKPATETTLGTPVVATPSDVNQSSTESTTLDATSPPTHSESIVDDASEQASDLPEEEEKT